MIEIYICIIVSNNHINQSFEWNVKMRKQFKYEIIEIKIIKCEIHLISIFNKFEIEMINN